MFRDIVIPLQAWLLSQGRCFNCGLELEKAKKERKRNGFEKATCQCGRIFYYNKKTQKYRSNFNLLLNREIKY